MKRRPPLDSEELQMLDESDCNWVNAWKQAVKNNGKPDLGMEVLPPIKLRINQLKK